MMMRGNTYYLWGVLLVCFAWMHGRPVQATTPVSHGITTQDSAPSVEQVEEMFADDDQKDHRAAPTQATLPPLWLVTPFILLLLTIALGPLLYAKLWHRYYPSWVIFSTLSVAGYYLLVLQDGERLLVALMEYAQFIALIVALYVTSGGVLITLHRQATPALNVGMLLAGAVVANLIGTTGASMLLIRPYMRLNHARLRGYHVAFFIFIVSNVGGVLTPIGDPPLFLGFLSGVPFFWTLQHNFLPWLVALALLSAVFYYLDRRDARLQPSSPIASKEGATWCIVGRRNLVWFTLIIGAVFLDPHLLDWVPALHYGSHSFSFVRELILLVIAWLAYYHADQEVLQENAFSLAPLHEVTVLFVGIFVTMVPALQWIGAFADSPAGHAFITPHTLYWGTGLFSSLLDNAPTYLNFSAASMASHGADIAVMQEVKAFALGEGYTSSVLQLKAISVASVFFGAMTYIGNGPNLMVKAIVEHRGIPMPSFFAYILHFSAPILLPVLFIIWLLFFAFA